MNSDVKDPDRRPLAPCSRIWMAYFLVSIAVIGFPLCAGICIPFYLLGFLYPPAAFPADQVMRVGIGWLMQAQPWLDSDIEIQLPDRQGVLLVANHRSHLDVFLLLSRVRGIRILAKNTLYSVPFLGLMMRVSGQIPVRRGDVRSFMGAMDRVEQKLLEGETVQVFPEMQRCEPGEAGTRNFLVAPFLAARRAGRQVIPIVIEGTDGAWPKGRFAIRPHTPIRMRTLEPLDPAGFPSAEALCLETRRRIEEALA